MARKRIELFLFCWNCLRNEGFLVSECYIGIVLFSQDTSNVHQNRLKYYVNIEYGLEAGLNVHCFVARTNSKASSLTEHWATWPIIFAVFLSSKRIWKLNLCRYVCATLKICIIATKITWFFFRDSSHLFLNGQSKLYLKDWTVYQK